jgi:hypothetical protein
MPSLTRLIYPIDDWYDWYRDVLAAMEALTPADVLARWAAMAAPSYQPAGLRPSDEVLAASPRHKYLEMNSQWWVRDDDAAAMATAKAGISWDAAGPFLRLWTGEIVRDQATARRHLGDLAGDPTLPALLALFLTGRQDDKRKTMSREILARAMVVLGLRDAGLSHLRAARTWLSWECDLCGALGRPDIYAILKSGATADAVDKQRLKDYQRTVCLTNRRTWSQLGVPVRIPREFAPLA